MIFYFRFLAMTQTKTWELDFSSHMSTLTTASEFHTIVRCLVLIIFAMFGCSESDTAALNESGRSVVPTPFWSFQIIPSRSNITVGQSDAFLAPSFSRPVTNNCNWWWSWPETNPLFAFLEGWSPKVDSVPFFFSVFLVTLFKHKVVQNIIGWLQPSVGSAIKDLSSAPAAIAHFLSIYEWSRIRAKGHSQPL